MKFLLSLLALSVLVLAASAGKTTIDVFLEPFCPHSIRFSANSLGSFINALDEFEEVEAFTSQYDLNIWYFGNGYEKKRCDGSYRFVCQHGPQECLVNKILNCALDQGAYDFGLPFIACYNDNIDKFTDKYVKLANKCGSQSSMLFDLAPFMDCVEGARGGELLHNVLTVTDEKAGDRDYVPYVLVNGEHNLKAENNIIENLAGYICSQDGANFDFCDPKNGARCVEEAIQPPVRFGRTFRSNKILEKLLKNLN